MNIDSVQAVEAAIWSGDPTALDGLPRVDPASWNGAIQSEYLSFGVDATLPFATTAYPACLQIAIVMMVKDEADIIGHNLAWLHFSGVRRFIVLDNGSTDGTRAHLQAFRLRSPDIDLIIVDDPRVSYMQALRTTGMMRLALSLWPDLQWIFPVDADEFLIPSQGFDPLLALPSSIDAITIPRVVHFCDSEVSDPLAVSPMAEMPLRNKLFTRAPNVGSRAQNGMGVTDGNHHSTPISGRAPIYHGAFSLGLYYREYQIRSAAHFLLKTLNGAPAVLTAVKDGQFSGGSHWLHYYKVLQTEGEEGLNRHFIGECVKKLDQAIDLDPFLGVPEF